MAADELLLDRIRNTMDTKHVPWEEIKMFGGHCFMVDQKMCFGTYKGGMEFNPKAKASKKKKKK